MYVRMIVVEEEGDDVDPRLLLSNRGSEFHCEGELTLLHWNPASGMSSLKTSRLKGKYFLDTGRRLLRYRQVLHVRVDGTCCWKLHSRRNFRGSFQSLTVGQDGPFEAFNPLSIKKVTCSTLF